MRIREIKPRRCSLVKFKYLIAVKDSDELSGRTRIYAILSGNQSVLRKVGFELSYRMKKVKVIRFVLQLSNTSISEGDQVSIGKI